MACGAADFGTRGELFVGCRPQKWAQGTCLGHVSTPNMRSHVHLRLASQKKGKVLGQAPTYGVRSSVGGLAFPSGPPILEEDSHGHSGAQPEEPHAALPQSVVAAGSQQDLPPGSSQDGDLKAPTESISRDLPSQGPRDLNLLPPARLQAHLNMRAHLRLRQRRRRLLIKKMPAAAAIPANSSAGTFVRPALRALDGHWVSLHQSQEERKRVMREACAKYRASSSRRAVTPRHVSRIFVEDRHRVLYCEVPKAGCSNWKRVLMVLAGLASSTADIQHNTVHYGGALKRLDAFDRQGILHRLSTYTKMLFVREPFERLVSAFRDKFEHPNSYYHPVFGKAILARYRANASREALRTGAGVRFPEFVQYLLDVHRPVGMDIHWDHVSRLCSPCLIDYDFVGKFESMEDDANFFLSLIRAPRNLTFPRFKDRHAQEARTTARIARRYFAQLSALQRQRAYDFYYMDYLMFNYSKPFADLY
ncbi:PREDICTED: carbohydrate sulfotransferase 8 [Ceratotherium simum simum]|uniref:Carbohydrate sulfotransferase n=1 Tax=Ceratotherium simum simum TaxID=73337 RepID=A0ABM1DEJ4_CERSS|nr:PREDICTED: carbohydrate sulfotransferase 8 [Ceratotherium simum simum]